MNSNNENSYGNRHANFLVKLLVFLLTVLFLIAIVYSFFQFQKLTEENKALKSSIQDVELKNITQNRAIQDIKEKQINFEDNYQNNVDFDKRLQEIEKNLSFLSMDLKMYNMFSTSNDSAIFNLSDTSGYSRFDANNGVFFLIIDEVQPYLEGYKIKARIGNPQSCVYVGFDLNVKWGAEYDSSNKDQTYDDWKKTLNEKDLSYSTISLEKGSWTSIDIILAPMTAEETRYVEFTIRTNIVSLN